jgi:drug/metabolite transporter (DMT)-like permease
MMLAIIKELNTVDTGRMGSFVMAVALLVFAFYIVYSGRLAQKPLSDHAFQILGLTLLVPVLLIMISANVSRDSLIGFFGTIIGYVFGTANARDRKQGTTPAEDQQEHKNAPA